MKEIELWDYKKVFNKLSCSYVTAYWSLETTWIELKKLKKIIKELKRIWVVYTDVGFNEDTWLIAWRWFITYSTIEINKRVEKWEITLENYERFLDIINTKIWIFWD